MDDTLFIHVDGIDTTRINEILSDAYAMESAFNLQVINGEKLEAALEGYEEEDEELEGAMEASQKRIDKKIAKSDVAREKAAEAGEAGKDGKEASLKKRANIQRTGAFKGGEKDAKRVTKEAAKEEMKKVYSGLLGKLKWICNSITGKKTKVFNKAAMAELNGSYMRTSENLRKTILKMNIKDINALGDSDSQKQMYTMLTTAAYKEDPNMTAEDCKGMIGEYLQDFAKTYGVAVKVIDTAAKENPGDFVGIMKGVIRSVLSLLAFPFKMLGRLASGGEKKAEATA